MYIKLVKYTSRMIWGHSTNHLTTGCKGFLEVYRSHERNKFEARKFCEVFLHLLLSEGFLQFQAVFRFHIH